MTIAVAPPRSRKPITARIFGPMLPSAKCVPSARYAFASDSVIRSTHSCSGVP